MDKFKAAFYSLSIITACILIIYGINVFPVPGTDSIVFIPPAQLFSKGFGLENPLYYVTQFTDPTHTNRYNYYVPFFSWLLGCLSKVKPGVKTIFFFCALFSTANLLLYTRLIASLINGKVSVWLKAAILLAIVYMSTYLLPTIGRPENLTSLLVFAVYLLHRNKEKYSPMVYSLLIVVLLAMILATQIICFYFCFLFFITYELLQTTNLYRTIGINIARGGGVIVVFCLILALSPNGLINTINGIRIHIHYVIDRSDRSMALFVHYWLLAPINFGFVFVFLIACIYYSRELYSKLKDRPLLNIALVITVQAIISYGLINFILYAGPTIYNATEFIMPLTAYIIINMLADTAGTKRYLLPVAMVTYLCGGFLFLRTALLFIAYKNSGKDYDHARILVNQVAKEHQGAYITNSLWCLYDNLNDERIFYNQGFKKGDIILVQEVNHEFPEALVGKCTIIYDWRSKEPSRVMGIKLANRPQGFGFVVCCVN